MEKTLIYNFIIDNNTSISSSNSQLDNYPDAEYNSISYCFTPSEGNVWTNGEVIRYVLYSENETHVGWWEIPEPNWEEDEDYTQI